MWNPISRRRHSRAGLRYASNMPDEEWRLLEPLLPGPRRRGRRRSWPLREIVNAIFYVLRAGCAWRLLPDSLPPWRTVYRWFAGLRDGGVLESLNHHLVALDRERAGRGASPTAAVIDTQSVKTAEGGRPRGYDAGKKVILRAEGILGLAMHNRLVVPLSAAEAAEAALMEAGRRIAGVELLLTVDRAGEDACEATA